MVRQETHRNFLQDAIRGLSKEEFDELVRIFQMSYWHDIEVVNVDGTNDGGCDIKVYKNKKEQKRCIQVTIQKKLENKLKKDLGKVSEMISNYGYSNRFEFYCTIPISEEKIEEYKKYALEEHDIVLEIYEARRLSQLQCKEVVEYIYSLHPNLVLKPEQMDIDRATKTLYDLLANGKDSSDIKNSLIDSVIISIVYEKAPIGLPDLKKELEERLGKNLPDILHSINRLKTDQRIVKDKVDPKLLCLSEIEYNNVQDIIASSAKTEKDFCDSIAQILAKYNIEYSEKILEELKNLYRFNYASDIDDCEKKTKEKDEDTDVIKFESFKKYLLNLISDKNDIDSLISEVRLLCISNSYLNKISAGESFLSLYKSNQLERYLSQKHKDIFLDTPTFVYLLCAYYGIEENDWDNPFYRSMKNLIKIQDSYPNKISFFITQDYLTEVAGEIKKALQYSQFENYPFFKDMGGTRNTLFNYYEYLKKSDLFFEDDNIANFEGFLYSLGMDNTSFNDDKFIKDTVRFLYDITDEYGICVSEWAKNERFREIKDRYEIILMRETKDKSPSAIKNDVNQVIILLEHDNSNSDSYLATWDRTIPLLRDEMLSDDERKKYHYFNICNPARLSNRIALENFNIDESALTNDIFAYADKKYDISNRVKSLLELLAPFLKENGTGSKNLFRKLGRIRKQQIELSGADMGNEQEEKNLPIEEIVMLLVPNEDKIKQDDKILEKFSVFMSSEANTDYIIETINKISEYKDFREYDFSDYYNRIESVDINTLCG